MKTNKPSLNLVIYAYLYISTARFIICGRTDVHVRISLMALTLNPKIYRKRSYLGDDRICFMRWRNIS